MKISITGKMFTAALALALTTGCDNDVRNRDLDDNNRITGFERDNRDVRDGNVRDGVRDNSTGMNDDGRSTSSTSGVGTSTDDDTTTGAKTTKKKRSTTGSTTSGTTY